MKKTGCTVDEAMLLLPKAELVIVKKLRALILECLPKATEEPKYGYGVPFYVRNRMICFIWPSSIYWGLKRTDQIKKTNLVTLGFCQVYFMYINSLAEIKEEQIRAMLYEAELIDEHFGRKKKAKKIGK